MEVATHLNILAWDIPWTGKTMTRNITTPFKKKKKNVTVPFAAVWIDLDNIMLTKISQ